MCQRTSWVTDTECQSLFPYIKSKWSLNAMWYPRSDTATEKGY